MQATFIETPRGIFTAAGNWFHTTTGRLRNYAPGLLKKHNLEKIIQDAEIWVRSADSLSIILFMGLLYFVNIQVAFIFTLFFLPFWHLNKSAFVNIASTRLMKLIDYEIFQVALSIAVLSYMGMNELYYSLITGLLFFFFLKFGWYRNLTDYVFRRQPNQLTLNDRVLKMVILRYAMYENINIAEVRQMESDFLDMISKNKKK